MLKTILGILIVLTISNVSQAQWDTLNGVNTDGSPLSTKNMVKDTGVFYIVHGGCRPSGWNYPTTEIWLYLAKKPNVEYNPSTLDTTYLHLASDPKSFTSVLTCRFLADSMANQRPVWLTVLKYPNWPNATVVSEIEKIQMGFAVKSALEPPVLVENFSVEAHAHTGCK